ncbi:hypothetical protein D3C78_1880110 [compost metagenome]
MVGYYNNAVVVGHEAVGLIAQAVANSLVDSLATHTQEGAHVSFQDTRAVLFV